MTKILVIAIATLLIMAGLSIGAVMARPSSPLGDSTTEVSFEESAVIEVIIHDIGPDGEPTKCHTTNKELFFKRNEVIERCDLDDFKKRSPEEATGSNEVESP